MERTRSHNLEASDIIGGSVIYAQYVAQRAQALRAAGKDGDSRDAKTDERAKLLDKLDNDADGLLGEVILKTASFYLRWRRDYRGQRNDCSPVRGAIHGEWIGGLPQHRAHSPLFLFVSVGHPNFGTRVRDHFSCRLRRSLYTRSS